MSWFTPLADILSGLHVAPWLLFTGISGSWLMRLPWITSPKMSLQLQYREACACGLKQNWIFHFQTVLFSVSFNQVVGITAQINTKKSFKEWSESMPCMESRAEYRDNEGVVMGEANLHCWSKHPHTRKPIQSCVTLIPNKNQADLSVCWWLFIPVHIKMSENTWKPSALYDRQWISLTLWNRAGNATGIPATLWLIRNRSMKMRGSDITATVIFLLWKTGALLKTIVYFVDLCPKSLFCTNDS